MAVEKRKLEAINYFRIWYKWKVIDAGSRRCLGKECRCTDHKKRLETVEGVKCEGIKTGLRMWTERMEGQWKARRGKQASRPGERRSCFAGC